MNMNSCMRERMLCVSSASSELYTYKLLGYIIAANNIPVLEPSLVSTRLGHEGSELPVYGIIKKWMMKKRYHTRDKCLGLSLPS